MLKAWGKGRKRAETSRTVQVTAPAVMPVAQPTYAPRAADMTVGDYANGVPHIRIGAMFGSLIRQFLWVIPLFAVGCVVAWFLTADFKRSYTGEGTLMVQLGDEYVYQPAAGTQGQSSLLQTPDTITLNEVAIIKNTAVMDTVIAQIMDGPGGLAAFDPSIAAKMARHPEGSPGYQTAYMELRRMMDRNYAVAARPKSSIIDLAYKHTDPQFAVSTLNALMGAYMDYRRALFVEGAGAAVTERRGDTEGQLRDNERRMAQFLSSNGVSNFESEQQGVSKRTEDLRASLNTLRAQMAATERSLATVEDQLRVTPETINLYVDDRASNRLAQAELELKQLLAKYLPTSDPVIQKQREIEEIRTLQRSAGGQATGGRRVGPNPVYQDLMRNRNLMQAQADSQREQEVIVQRQLNESDARLRKMTSLLPAYNDLLRERETLEARLKTYLSKEQEALINQQRAESALENVRVISTANYPVKGRNMRLLAFVGASAAWGFTLFMLALFRVFLDPALYAGPSVRRTPEPAMPNGYAMTAYAPQMEAVQAAQPAYAPDPYALAAPQAEPVYRPSEPSEHMPPAGHAPQAGYAPQAEYAPQESHAPQEWSPSQPAAPYQPAEPHADAQPYAPSATPYADVTAAVHDPYAAVPNPYAPQQTDAAQQGYPVAYNPYQDRGTG